MGPRGRQGKDRQATYFTKEKVKVDHGCLTLVGPISKGKGCGVDGIAWKR